MRPPPVSRRAESQGSRELGQRKEAGGDGAAYGHARCAGEAVDRDPGRVWTARSPGTPMWTTTVDRACPPDRQNQSCLCQCEHRGHDDENGHCRHKRKPPAGQGDAPDTQPRGLRRTVTASPGAGRNKVGHDGAGGRDLRRLTVSLRFDLAQDLRPDDRLRSGRLNHRRQRCSRGRVDRWRRCFWLGPLEPPARRLRDRRPLRLGRLPRSIQDLGVGGRTRRDGTQEAQKTGKTIGGEPVHRLCLDAPPPNPPTTMRHLSLSIHEGQSCWVAITKTYAIRRTLMEDSWKVAGWADGSCPPSRLACPPGHQRMAQTFRSISNKLTQTTANWHKNSDESPVHPAADVVIVADDHDQGDTDPPHPAGDHRVRQRTQPGIQPEQRRRGDR